MGNPRRVDETETDFLVRRLREWKTPNDLEEAIKSALTFPAAGESLQSKLDLERIYTESCILVDEFGSRYEEGWGFRWLPEKPTYNKDTMAGLHEHRQWYNRVERAVRSELPRRFNPAKVELSIKRFEELRDLLVKYPSYDQQLWEKAKDRAGVAEKLSSMRKSSFHFRLLEGVGRFSSSAVPSGAPLLPQLSQQIEQARKAELGALLEAEVAYTPEVDRCYRELDGRYAAAVQQLAEEVEGLWKDRILSIWDRQEPIWLYEALTGKTISGPMERLQYAASEIANGRMVNPLHRAEMRKNCETLIALFKGFREKICQAQSDEADAGIEGKAEAGQPSKTPSGKKKEKGLKRTITASILFLAGLLTVLQTLFGWIGIIWRFLTGK